MVAHFGTFCAVRGLHTGWVRPMRKSAIFAIAWPDPLPKAGASIVAPRQRSKPSLRRGPFDLVFLPARPPVFSRPIDSPPRNEARAGIIRWLRSASTAPSRAHPLPQTLEFDLSSCGRCKRRCYLSEGTMPASTSAHIRLSLARNASCRTTGSG